MIHLESFLIFLKYQSAPFQREILFCRSFNHKR